MIQPRLRRAWLTLHRWVGLTFGLVLLSSAVSGTLLVAARPIDEALHPELFRSRGDGQGALQPVVLRLRAEFGPEAAFNLRLPREAGRSLQVGVSGRWNGTVYVDAASGQELGRRATGQGLFETLFELHSTLLAADLGRAVLAAAALAYALMLASGLALWWPVRWRHAFSLRTRAGTTFALMDVHRVAGAGLGLLVLVSVASGAYMAWRPLAGWVTWLSGRPPLMRPSAVPAATPASMPDAAIAGASIDTAVQLASRHWPDAMTSVVHVPAHSVAASRLRMRLADDPHPIGMTTAWLNLGDGALHTAQRWTELDAGNRAFSIVYPLHTGSLYGIATLFTTFAAGAALTVFGCTGAWLWFRRRRG